MKNYLSKLLLFAPHEKKLQFHFHGESYEIQFHYTLLKGVYDVEGKSSTGKPLGVTMCYPRLTKVLQDKVFFFILNPRSAYRQSVDYGKKYLAFSLEPELELLIEFRTNASGFFQVEKITYLGNAPPVQEKPHFTDYRFSYYLYGVLKKCETGQCPC